MYFANKNHETQSGEGCCMRSWMLNAKPNDARLWRHRSQYLFCIYIYKVYERMNEQGGRKNTWCGIKMQWNWVWKRNKEDLKNLSKTKFTRLFLKPISQWILRISNFTYCSKTLGLKYLQWSWNYWKHP